MTPLAWLCIWLAALALSLLALHWFERSKGMDDD